MTASSPPTATATAASAPSSPAASGAGPQSSQAASGTAQQLPITVSAQLSSPQQSTSILAPASCVLQDGVLTATGSFTGGFVPEDYERYGDVVELYVYTAVSQGQAIQLADLSAEKPYPIGGKGPWKVTVPVETQFGTPTHCLVAVQSTHAFMGAPNVF